MQNNKFIFTLKEGENVYKFITKNGNGWCKHPKPFDDFREGISMGFLTIVCGLRKDKEYFDYSHPKDPKNSGVLKFKTSYDSNYFSDDITDVIDGEAMNHNLWYPQLSRNSQNIGIIKSLPKLKPGVARADTWSRLFKNHLRTVVKYNVNSSQDNIMDNLMGIQENKNQLNSHDTDEGFRRLIEYCMTKTFESIKADFQERIQKEEEPDPPESESESEEEPDPPQPDPPQPDSEEDPDSEEEPDPPQPDPPELQEKIEQFLEEIKKMNRGELEKKLLNYMIKSYETRLKLTNNA